MPIREIHLLCGPIVTLLQGGERPAWEIEEELAKQFKVTEKERAIPHAFGGAAWTNNVAHALKDLVNRKTIRNMGRRKAPGGNKRSAYRLP
jgi:hypothetical protein